MLTYNKLTFDAKKNIKLKIVIKIQPFVAKLNTD